MRNVQRPQKPTSLVNNSDNWTTELLNEINRCSLLNLKVDERFYNKYNQQDIKNVLKSMYDNLCCYCESHIGTTDYINIEHRKPKRSKNGIPLIPYPELIYDWNNLHLSCTKCNIAKGTKYDTANPILDAVLDIPIEAHFKYTEGTDGINWTPLTPRGATTEKHADLNREPLPNNRLKILGGVIMILQEIKNNPTNPANTVALNEVRKKVNGPYGSLIKFLLTHFAANRKEMIVFQ